MNPTTTRTFLHGALALGLSGCFGVATPLSRSYDDPYNAPLPNEPAPPSLTTRQEQCSRDPINGCSNTARMCKKDKQCDQGQVCERGLCIYEEVEVIEVPLEEAPEEEEPSPES